MEFPSQIVDDTARAGSERLRRRRPFQNGDGAQSLRVQHDQAMALPELAERVTEAAEQALRPPPLGETRPLAFTTDYLGDDGWTLLWEVVRQIREDDTATFLLFPELTLALLVVELLEEKKDLGLPGLIAALAERAEHDGPRAVSTPITHLEMDVSAIPLSDDAILVRADDNRHVEETDEDVLARFEIERRLGVPMSRPMRLLERDPGGVFDSTRTCSLLTVETGAVGLALARARARAQYAIAMWAVLAPPTQGQVVLPDVGVMVPQPYTRIPQRHRLIREHRTLAARPPEVSDGSYHLGAFPQPSEGDLRLPFEATAHLESRGAQSVLSAGLHLLNAGRVTRLQPSERARAIMSAIEALGENPDPKLNDAHDRFKRLTQRHGTDSAAEQRGWTIDRVGDALRRIRTARNIATHGVDGVRLDLGFPPDDTRPMRYGKDALGAELATGSLQADLPALVHVVGRTLELTIRELGRDGWSNDHFERYFQ